MHFKDTNSPLEKGVGGLTSQKLEMEKSNYNKTHKPFSQKLRKNSTQGEIILWTKVLENKQMLGFQFNRQFPIDKYIVDFICRKIKLIVEIDGYSHQFKYNIDIERDKLLSALGYRVLRFTEKEILNDLNNVIRGIEIYVLNKVNPPAPLLAPLVRALPFSKGESIN